jgi:hypothetical protein
MGWHESNIRRRVARWRAALARLLPTGRVRRRQPLPLSVIRERVAEMRARTVVERMAMDPAVYGDLTDQAHLLDLLDETARQLAYFQKAPTTPLPIVRDRIDARDTEVDLERPFAVPAAPVIPVEADAVHNLAIEAACAAVRASISRGITLRLPMDAMRDSVVYDLKALRRGVA